MQRIKKEFHEFHILLNTVPTTVVVLFVMAVFSMNLLANKSIEVGSGGLFLQDCGIIFSWVSFFLMDMMTKYFGPKASTEISIFSVAATLLFYLMFSLASFIPGNWSESYVDGAQGAINLALNVTFRGTWYVLLGSVIATVCSAFINNFLNHGIGKLIGFKHNNFFQYAVRSYSSTIIGQFCDNLIFALLVSRLFFGVGFSTCLFMALCGLVFEVVGEVIFSPLGFKICRDWEKKEVGREYFELVRAKNKEYRTKSIEQRA